MGLKGARAECHCSKDWRYSRAIAPMAETEGTGFKPRPKHLLPVALGLVVTGFLGYPLFNSGAPTAQVTPFTGDSVTNASLNALIFVFALGASASAMVLLIRKGRMGFIRRMIKVALVVVSFAVAFWYTTSLVSLVINLTDLSTLLLLALSVGIAASIGVTIFGKGKIRQLFGVTTLSALTGVFLGYSIGLITALVLVAALIVYDIVAVFRGPVGALAKTVGS